MELASVVDCTVGQGFGDMELPSGPVLVVFAFHNLNICLLTAYTDRCLLYINLLEFSMRFGDDQKGIFNIWKENSYAMQRLHPQLAHTCKLVHASNHAHAVLENMKPGKSRSLLD
jgi:hypothetical protein